MEDILPIVIVVGGLFVLIGFTADSIARAAIRRKVADRELSPEQIEGILKRRVDPESALKWALVTLALGIGFVVVQFLPEEMHDQPIVVGLLLALAGAALLVYRAMVSRGRGA